MLNLKSACPPSSAEHDWRCALLGAEIGLHYKILRPLASGGMSHVFLVEHVQAKTYAAVKMIEPYSGVPDTLLDHEAAMLARVRHPNIVRLIERGQTYEGDSYLLLELVDGIDLDEWLQDSSERLSRALLLHVLGQLASAIDAMHERGVVHSDIKPANVMLSPQQQYAVKLIDFGLAFDRREACARRGSAGTPGFMAPEQLRGEICGPAIDRFALAALAFELVTGAALRPSATLSSARSSAWTRSSPLSSRHTIQSALASVFSRALHDKPGVRFATATEFVHALARVLDDLALSPPPRAAADLSPVGRPNPASCARTGARKLALRRSAR